MADRRRYTLTLTKEPKEERRKFRALEAPDTYMEIRKGAVGDRVSYSVEMTKAEYHDALDAVPDPDSNLINIDPVKVLRFDSRGGSPGQATKRYGNTDMATDFGFSGQGVKVGVIDEAINAGTVAAAFNNNLECRSFIQGQSAIGPDSGYDSHGSGMAPVAIPENAQGYFATAGEYGAFGVMSDAATAAIYWLADEANVDVISMSFGGPGFDQAMADACGHAAGRGVLLFASMGNDGAQVTNYPGAYNGVHAIGNLDSSTNSPAPSTTYGTHCWGAANGINVTLFGSGGAKRLMPDGGTSTATAVAADIAARMLSNSETTLNTSQVEQRMQQKAKPISAGALYVGHGRLIFTHPDAVEQPGGGGGGGAGGEGNGQDAGDYGGPYEVYIVGCDMDGQPPPTEQPPGGPPMGGCKSSLKGPSSCFHPMPPGGPPPFGDPFPGDDDFPVEDWELPELPPLDCRMPNFGNGSDCPPTPGTGGMLPGGQDSGGNQGGTTGTVHTGGPTKEPRIKKVFEKKTCYPKRSSCMSTIYALLTEMGINPIKIIFQVGFEWDKPFTKCWQKGDKKWDAVEWLAERIMCRVIDEGNGKVYVGPAFHRPNKTVHVFNENINIFGISRSADATEAYRYVEVYGPRTGNPPPIVEVDLPFYIPPENILSIQVGANYSRQEAFGLAHYRAGLMRQEVVGLQVTVPYSKDYYLRDDMIIQQPSRNLQERYTITAKQSEISPNGRFSILTGMLPATLATLENTPDSTSEDVAAIDMFGDGG